MAEVIITTKEELQSIVKESVQEAIGQTKQPSQPKQRKPYTKIEVKNLLGVAMPTIDRWSRNGILKRIEIGSRVFFSAESVDELLKD